MLNFKRKLLKANEFKLAGISSLIRENTAFTRMKNVENFAKLKLIRYLK